jgi:hypothetical protein
MKLHYIPCVWLATERDILQKHRVCNVISFFKLTCHRKRYITETQGKLHYIPCVSVIYPFLWQVNLKNEITLHTLCFCNISLSVASQFKEWNYNTYPVFRNVISFFKLTCHRKGYITET